MKQYLLTGILVIASTLSCAALINGDFEAATLSPWINVQSTITREAGARTGGTGSFVVRMVGSGTLEPTIYQGDLNEITLNQPWRTRAWIRWTAGSTGTANFGFWGTSPPYGPSSSNALIPPTATTWAQYSVTHTWSSPDYADGYRDVQVTITGVNGTTTIEMDDVELSNTTAVTDWSCY